MTNFTLVAEELLATMGLLFGRVRGGLALSIVFVGALLAATTGAVGATVYLISFQAFSALSALKGAFLDGN